MMNVFMKSSAASVTVAVGIVAAVCLLPATSSAFLTTFSNRPGFEAQGFVWANSNFQDFGTGFGYPGEPFTRGYVTYQSSQNLTWGSATPYTTTEPLIGNNYWTPVLADIATGPKFDMFGFDIGTYGSSPITITIYTDSNSYVYPNLTIADSQLGQLEFRGFVASAGEYFTGFRIETDLGNFYLPGITHVTVGITDIAPSINAVPEPSTVALLGLGGLLVWRRRK